MGNENIVLYINPKKHLYPNLISHNNTNKEVCNIEIIYYNI